MGTKFRTNDMRTPLPVMKWGTGHSRVVALHGWGGSHATFLPLVRYVPSSHQLIAPDLPGYGQSKLPMEWTTKHIAEMIVHSVPNDRTITLVGNCTGGVIGAELALVNPGVVNRMVVIDPFAYMPWYFGIFLKGNFGRMAYRTTFASQVGRYVMNQALRNRRTGDADLTESFGRVNHDAVYAFLKMLAGHEGPARYEALEIPIDIITGEKTFGAVRKSVRMLQQVWPQSRVHVVADAGHLPIEERSWEVAKIVFRDE
jgi:pimeloyl-ACP methyl ester carboxylesterase